MNCKINNCKNKIMYKKAQLCQKHYFRFMRYGTYDLTRIGKGRDKFITPNGYVKILAFGHVLADKNNYAFEHRIVFYKKNQDKELCCEFCGKYWDWRSHKDHVDHVDNNPQNNHITNLRALCNACNTRRSRKPPHTDNGNFPIEFNGEVMTAEEWSRDERVFVSGACIRQRKSRGLSDFDALFMKKKTHNRVMATE